MYTCATSTSCCSACCCCARLVRRASRCSSCCRRLLSCCNDTYIAYVSIRQHTSAYVSIRPLLVLLPHTLVLQRHIYSSRSAHVSIRHTSAYSCAI